MQPVTAGGFSFQTFYIPDGGVKLFMELRESIVPVREWLDSEYYLGAESKSLLPFWKDVIVDYLGGDRREFIFSGSERAGKTYASCIIILRYIYELYCVKDFPSIFGLSPTTLPKIMFFSFTRAKADSSGVDRLIRMVDSIPWFQHPLHRRKPLTSRLEFPWVLVMSGVNINHALGEDMLAAVLDEANTRHVAKAREIEEAEALLMEINMRSVTTYSVNGKWYGFTGIISTAGTTSSFVDSQISEAKVKGSPRYIVEAAVYDVNPSKFSEERFEVYAGDSDVSPFIVDAPFPETAQEVLDSTGMTVEQFVSERREEGVLSVPVSLRRFYEDDIRVALANLSGITQASIKGLFRRKSEIDSMFDDTLECPARTRLPLMGLFDDFDPHAFIDEDTLFRNYHGEPVYCHADISRLYDMTGISFLFVDEEAHKIRSLLLTNIFYNARIPDNEIDQEKIVGLVRYLRELGVNFGYVSADQYASAYFLQQCKLLLGSNKVGYLSVDATAKAYLEVLNFARKGAFALYDNPKLRKELSELNYDLYSGKVDHPHNNDARASVKREADRDGIVSGFFSKDLADALSGAVYHIWAREEGFSGRPDDAPELTGDDDFYNDELYMDEGFYDEEPEAYGRKRRRDVEDEVQAFYDSLI